MKLSDFSKGRMLETCLLEQGRDNNFQVLRALAALAVIYSHSLALTHREDDVAGCTTVGMLAVSVFFVMSGFLITRSWQSQNHLGHFLAARAFRIYPALWVSVLGSLGMGLMLTKLSASDFLRHPQTLRFALKNGWQLFGFHSRLPGVFAENPNPHIINGSLWTLQYELILYLLVALVGWLGILENNRYFARYLGLVVVAYLFFQSWGMQNLTDFFRGSGLTAFIWLRMSLYFALGGAAYMFRKKLPLNWPLALMALTICGLALTLRDVDFLLPPALSYLVLALVFLPGGWVRQFNLLGDFSYGLYVYAFPIQQTVIFLYLKNQPPIVGKNPVWNVGEFFAISVVITALVAIPSWYFVEKPCLQIASKWKKRAHRSATQV